ncbi:MAG: hypothetical protein ABEJ03_00460 [Candidatus Nanohaloarchaea archaeon]
MGDTRRGFIQRLSAALFGSKMDGAISEASPIDPNNERFEHVIVPEAKEVSVATKVVSRREDEVEENFPAGKREKKIPLETESDKVISFIPLRYDSQKDEYHAWSPEHGWKVPDNVEDIERYRDFLFWRNTYTVRASDIDNGEKIWEVCNHVELEADRLSELLSGQSSDLNQLNNLIETRLPKGSEGIDDLVDSILQSSNKSNGEVKREILEEKGDGSRRVVNEESEEYQWFLGKDKVQLFYSGPRDYSDVPGIEVERFMNDLDEPSIWPKYEKSEDQRDSENLWVDNGIVLERIDEDESYSIDFTDLENERNYADENIYHGDEIVINVGVSNGEARASIKTTGESQNSTEKLNYKLNQLSNGDLEPTNNDEKALVRVIEYKTD